MWGWKMGEDLFMEFILWYFLNDFTILHHICQSRRGELHSPFYRQVSMVELPKHSIFESGFTGLDITSTL
jgi:hypothetical protein